MRELITLLQSLAARGFYGSLEIEFKEGRIVLLRQSETIKPPFLTSSQRENRNDERERAS